MRVKDLKYLLNSLNDDLPVFIGTDHNKASLLEQIEIRSTLDEDTNKNQLAIVLQDDYHCECDANGIKRMVYNWYYRGKIDGKLGTYTSGEYVNSLPVEE